MKEIQEHKKRLWHPFAFLFGGIVLSGALWSGTGYCFGYGIDHPTPAAIAGAMGGLGAVFALSGLIALILCVAAMIETFPSTPDDPSKREDS